MASDSEYESASDILDLAQWQEGEKVQPVELAVIQARRTPVTEVPPVTAEDEEEDSPFDLFGSPSKEDAPEVSDATEDVTTAEADADIASMLPSTPKAASAPGDIDFGDDEDFSQEDATAAAAAFMADAGLAQQREVPNIEKPWMKFHSFVGVHSIDELNEIVDKAIAAGVCSLDLETQGLDNRVYWRSLEDTKNVLHEHWDDVRPARTPQTVHKIVGYCLSYDGKTGYYIPVRHTAPNSKNIDPIEAGKVIKRLCLAAQPVITEEGLRNDPFGSSAIQEPGKVKILFWHAKFDQEFLYPVTGIDYWHPDSFEDGMLLYYCKYTNDKQLSLKHKAPQELFVKDEKGTPHPYEMIELKQLFIRGRPIDFASLHPEEPGVLKYGGSDGICTFLLCTKATTLFAIKDPRYAGMYRIEKQVAQVVRVMERNRIKVDRPYLVALLAEAKDELGKFHAQIILLAEQHSFHGFDPNSTKQLSDFLFSDKGLNLSPKPPLNEKSGQFKTDADTLEKLVEDHPQINPVLLTVVKYRQVFRVIGIIEALINNADKNSEIRYQFKQTGAPTGRFASPKGDPEHGYSGVPMHGIPATYDEKKPKCAIGLRRAFIARDGYTIVKVDFAGEELRIVTNLSKEQVWIKEFNEGSGDLHSITARAFFSKAEVTKQERQQGKIANFSLVYGGGAQAIMRATGCNQTEGSRRKSNFDKAMPIFTKWVRSQKEKVKRDKGVFTPFGRWMAIPEIESPDRMLAAAAERWSINYPIQGAGADIMKMALVMLHKEFYKRGWLQAEDVRMMLTIHDEIVFEVRHSKLMEIMPVIEKFMCEPGRMAGWRKPKGVELEVESLIDSSWDAKYDYHKVMHGRAAKPDDKLKKNEIRVGDRIYQSIPSWLEGMLVPDYLRKEGESAPTSTPPSATSTPPSGTSNPATVMVTLPTPAGSVSTPLVAKANGSNGQANGSNGHAKVPATKVDMFRIGGTLALTKYAVKSVLAAISESLDSNGSTLHLIEASSGTTLVDPARNIKINPSEFERKLRDRGL